MKLLILKVIAFLFLLIGLYYANMYAFRSDFPAITVITFIGSVILLVFFPYNKFFKIK
jgi:hypothetical protein